jgi:hypothetical protein
MALFYDSPIKIPLTPPVIKGEVEETKILPFSKGEIEGIS